MSNLNAMKPSALFALKRDLIRSLILQSGVTNPRLFGSVSRAQDTDESDLDILVDPMPGTSLLDIAKLQVRLEKELGISVDILTPLALPVSCRSYILENAIPV